ncbi:ComEC/Rec2 family competence protein [Paludisphaera rhizosphaerae]|uniref:ComEC/Rec2 family competence protein n=1 Tax=Paludisphaera rhizosphaerae TaxID=2711216 RepID=UPI001F0F7F09|nr:ComEC/Rec2 family competence protein [Paludisphaera rhizosphaerae]
MAPVAAALVVGTVADRSLEPFSTSGWAITAMALAVLAWWAIRRPRASTVLVVGAMVAAGGAYHHDRWSDVAPNDLASCLDETPSPAWVRGHVEEVVGRNTREGRGPDDPDRTRTRFTLWIEAVSDGSTFHPRTGRADVVVQGDAPGLLAGQPVQVAGRLSRVSGPLNPGEFDRRAFLQARGIRLAMTVDEPEGVMPDPGRPWSRSAGLLGSIREWSRDRLVEGLSPAAAPLASALVLGRRDDMDPEVGDAFARTGTTHLLAVSGLQLQVMAGAIGLGLVLLGVPRRLRYVLVALAAVGYAALVGGSPSVVRSMVMTVAFCVALLASRRPSPANVLATAGVLTFAINPSFLFDVGCQLSFLAVAALFWLLPRASAFGDAVELRLLGPPDPLDQLDPWRQSIPGRVYLWAAQTTTTLLAASAVVWAAAAPLSALRFHLFSPVGVLLNVPLTITTSAALLAGAFKLTAAALGLSPLAKVAGWVVSAMLGLSETIVRWGAAIPWGSWYTPGPPAASVLVFYALLGAAAYLTTAGPRRGEPTTALRWARRIAWAMVLGWCVPGWLLSGIGRRPATLEVDVLAVGHGLAVAIHTPEGKAFLYDCGRMDDPSVGRRIVAPALWSRGVSRIDAVFLSHADQDHFNGLPDVLNRFTVGEVVVAPEFAGRDNPAATALMEEVKRQGVPVRTVFAPEEWRSGSVRFQILHPPAGWTSDVADNARSLVLNVSLNDRRLLLTGDLEQIGLVELLSLPRPSRPVDVMLAPHHGGKSANPPRLYDWAEPHLVVASQKPPPTGSADALTPLEARDIVLLRTWQVGAVSLQWLPTGVVARGFLDRGRPE